MPVEVQSLIAYRNSESEEAQALIAGGLDNVRWDLLSDAAKGPTVWAALACKMGPQALRMNLNTLLRHGVFNVVEHSVVQRTVANDRGAINDNMVDYVADRIADESEIRRSKQFPYQYFAAYLNADDNVPQKIKTALHKAAEIACGNVPELPGPVVIGLDTSGSMSSAVTGHRGRGATSKMRCIDVAALFAAAILRRNPSGCGNVQTRTALSELPVPNSLPSGLNAGAQTLLAVMPRDGSTCRLGSCHSSQALKNLLRMGSARMWSREAPNCRHVGRQIGLAKLRHLGKPVKTSS